jgi:excisionase family DNA binding protein
MEVVLVVVEEKMAGSLSAVEAARRLGVTLDHIYKQLRAGRLDGAVKSRGQWLIPAQAIKTKLRRRGAGEEVQS